MHRFATLTASLTALTLLGTLTMPSATEAATKEMECAFQGDLMSAVQQARLDRVNINALTETLMGNNPDWPEGTATVLPALGEYVYGLRRRELKQVDLGATTQMQCLENWDQLQSLKSSIAD